MQNKITKNEAVSLFRQARGNSFKADIERMAQVGFHDSKQYLEAKREWDLETEAILKTLMIVRRRRKAK